jgi:hypothetical protein
MVPNLFKFKRLFTIGCSFTEYFYPTWANVLSKSMPYAEFYNLGLSGTSNPFIANRLVEANIKFKFCETDLVVVMWTTTARETHYVRGRWYNPGNIFSQDVYSKEFVEKFADPNGYLIRDLATIELATAYANNLPCTYVGLLSTPIDFRYLGDHNPGLDDELACDILDTYSELLASFPKSLFELEMKGVWDPGSKYKSTMFKGTRDDYHPDPTRYCNYLAKVGFPITGDAINYAEASTATIQKLSHRKDFVAEFPYCHDYKVDGIW